MKAQDYCETVEEQDRLHRQLIPTVPVRDDHTPLISLKRSGFRLIFEPCIMKNYGYFVRAAVFEKVGRISARLVQEQKVLIIRSAWRSFTHQQRLKKYYSEMVQRDHPEKRAAEIKKIVSTFIVPRKKSMHSTGGAVDALIYDLVADRIMDFGTNDGYKIDYDSRCYPHHPDVSPRAKQNRALLMGLFEAEDFVCDLKEYWHFDYGDAAWAIAKGRGHAIYGIVEDPPA